MCRALRIDAKPVLSKLPDARNPDLHTRPAMSSGFHTEVQRSNGGNLGSRTMLTVVGVLLVAAAALFWLPQSWLDQLSASVDRVLARGDKVAEAPAADATTGAPATVAEPVQVPVPAAPVTAPPVPAATPPAAAEPAAAPAHLLVFNVRSESWISVTEAGGKQLVHRTVPAGETVALSGTPPLSVVVGRAAGVDVQVRGKAFDLAPLARGGSVARFEVKP